MNRQKDNDTKGCPLFFLFLPQSATVLLTFSLSLIYSHSHTLPHYLSHFYTHIIFLANIFSVISIHKHLTCILTYKLTFSFVLSDYSFCFLSQPLSFLLFSLFPSIISLFACLCVWVFSIPYPFSTLSLPRACCTNSDRFLWPEIVQTSQTNSKPSCQETITQVSVQSIY